MEVAVLKKAVFCEHMKSDFYWIHTYSLMLEQLSWLWLG